MNNREKNEHLLYQIRTLGELLRCTHGHGETKVPESSTGEVEGYTYALYELGWDDSDAQKIREKIISLVSKLEEI